MRIRGEKIKKEMKWNKHCIDVVYGDGLTASLFNLSQTVLERWETHLNRNYLYIQFI